MKHCNRLVIAGLIAWLALPTMAQAGTCTFTPSGGTLTDFGTYFALGGDIDKQGNLAFTCVPTPVVEVTVSYTVQVSSGLSANQLDRRMYRGASSLRYNLFKDAARTQILGDGNSGTGILTGNCLTLCTLPVYGRLYGSQSGTAGAYSDAVTITINF